MHEVFTPDLERFFRLFMDKLTQESRITDAPFLGRFNDHFGSRTRLMLGSGGNRTGVVWRTLCDFLPPAVSEREVSYERWVDLVIWDEPWITGERVIPAAVEIENLAYEFKATLSDLLRLQARAKIGIFYEAGVNSERLLARWAEVTSLFRHFSNRGFKEAENTQYLMIFGPDHISEGEGIGFWYGMRFESGAKEFTPLRYPENAN